MTGRERYDVAVLDWGVGGLGFVHAYRALHPEARVLYLSDAGQEPYGMMPRAVLRRRLREVASWSRMRGARRLVVACNAASSALESNYELPVMGIIESGIEFVRRSGYVRIGVLGGRRTVLSGAYSAPLRAGGVHVVQRIAQPLSALVEAGVLSGPRVDGQLKRILGGLGTVDAILLACTHYPALMPAILRHRPRTPLLDPATALAKAVWASEVPPSEVPPSEVPPSEVRPTLLTCLTTGSPEDARSAATQAFRVDPGRFQRTRVGGRQFVETLAAEALRPHGPRERQDR